MSIFDAIHTARALVLRDHWPNMLCIIQDCTENTGRELVCVLYVYRDAHVAIAGFFKAST